MAAEGAPERLPRRGPAPIASFDHDISDEVRQPVCISFFRCTRVTRRLFYVAALMFSFICSRVQKRSSRHGCRRSVKTSGDAQGAWVWHRVRRVLARTQHRRAEVEAEACPHLASTSRAPRARVIKTRGTVHPNWLYSPARQVKILVQGWSSVSVKTALSTYVLPPKSSLFSKTHLASPRHLRSYRSNKPHATTRERTVRVLRWRC